MTRKFTEISYIVTMVTIAMLLFLRKFLNQYQKLSCLRVKNQNKSCRLQVVGHQRNLPYDQRRVRTLAAVRENQKALVVRRQYPPSLQYYWKKRQQGNFTVLLTMYYCVYVCAYIRPKSVSPGLPAKYVITNSPGQYLHYKLY